MGTSWIVVGLPMFAGTLFSALLTIVQRWALRGKSSPLLFIIFSHAMCSVAFGLTYIVWWGFVWPTGLLPGFWTVVLVATAVNFASPYFYAKATTYEQGEASLVGPLAALTPGLVTLVALTLGEVPGPRGFMGIALMVAGSWILMFKNKPEHWWEYLGPLRRLRSVLDWSAQSEAEKQHAKVVYLMLGAAAFSTVALLCEGLYMRRAQNMQGLFLGMSLLWALLSAAYIPIYFASNATAAEWSGEWRRFLLAGLAFGVSVVFITGFTTPVMLDTYVAYVGTLKRFSILLTVALGYLLFKEQDIKKRFVAAVVIVAGALLITGEDLPARLTAKIELFGF